MAPFVHFQLGDGAKFTGMDIAAGRGAIRAEFTEVESGRRNDRPELRAALAACQRERAVLVIAKLDRLARNFAFIAGLMESGVEFIAVDMPQANHLTIHILATGAARLERMAKARATVMPLIERLRGEGMSLGLSPPT